MAWPSLFAWIGSAGPLFAFAEYVAAQIYPEAAVLAGMLAVSCIFALGLLLVLALIPVWQRVTDFPLD